MGSKPTNKPAPTIHERMRAEFPRLWEMANQYDFAERLGGCSDPLYAEADAAMREIFSARTFIADSRSLFDDLDDA